MSIFPSLAPLHEISKPLKLEISAEILNASGSKIVYSFETKHPFWSVIFTVYVPGLKSLRSWVVALFDHA